MTTFVASTVADATGAGCTCSRVHTRRRVVLTGGPGAGKTAVLATASHLLCRHVVMVPEAAGILFLGGFPRRADPLARCAAQRAIYRVQLELETIADEENAALMLCDRGVVDGYAYWGSSDDYWKAVGTTREEAFARYHAVIHLRTPDDHYGYDHRNPVRTESVAEAAEIDRRILEAWHGHPRRFLVDATADFMTKTHHALELIRQEIPDCCRMHELHPDTVSARDRMYIEAKV